MKQILEELNEKYIARAPHMHDIGARVTAVDRARGSLVLPARADWLGDPVRGLLHHGPLTVLADSACGLAVGAALGRRMPYATLDLRMDYLRPAGPEFDVHCDAECFRLTRSVAFVRASVWQSDRDQPIATAQATFMLSTAPGTRPTAPGDLSTPAATESPALRTGASAATQEEDSATREEASSTASSGAPGWQPPAASESPLPGRVIPYVEYLGIRVAPDAARPLFRLPYQHKLIGNPWLPALHGGVIAGFAETAAILHLNQTLRGAKLPKGIDFSIDYLRSGRPEETFANCEVVRVGSRVALVQVRCWQQDPQRPIAIARAHMLLAPIAGEEPATPASA